MRGKNALSNGAKCVNVVVIISEVEANQIVAEGARISAEVGPVVEGPVAAQAQVAADRNVVVPVARHRVDVVLAGVKQVSMTHFFEEGHRGCGGLLVLRQSIR